jgi:hypothetical protein
MDALSLSSGIAGLISLGLVVIQQTFAIARDIKDYPDEVAKLLGMTRELYGLLCAMKSLIEANFQNSDGLSSAGC